MSETVPQSDPPKSTLAVLKGGPEFTSWFRRLQTLTRLPGALILDAALVEFARARGFDDPPLR